MDWRRCLFALSFAELLRTVHNNSARESVNSVHIETRPSSEASAIRDHLIFAGLIGACVPGPKWCRGPRARQCPLALCAPWERRSMGVSPCCGNHRSGKNAAPPGPRGPAQSIKKRGVQAARPLPTLINALCVSALAHARARAYASRTAERSGDVSTSYVRKRSWLAGAHVHGNNSASWRGLWHKHRGYMSCTVASVGCAAAGRSCRTSAAIPRAPGGSGEASADDEADQGTLPAKPFGYIDPQG